MISDTEGSWLICNLKAEETQFSLVNVYAPNMDSPSFFKQLFLQIENKGLENIIMGGFQSSAKYFTWQKWEQHRWQGGK